MIFPAAAIKTVEKTNMKNEELQTIESRPDELKSSSKYQPKLYIVATMMSRLNPLINRKK
jgi:hypothetical protein